jgi:cell division protein FtsW
MTIPWVAYQQRLRKLEDGPIDPVLAAVVIALIGFGVVMVYSASAIEAAVQLKDPQYYLKKQGFYAVVALGLMWVTSHVDYHRYRRHTYTIFALVTVLMLLCVLGFGHMGGGAKRWLAFGPIHVQPAEMAKLGLFVCGSYSLSGGRQDPHLSHRFRAAPHHGRLSHVPLPEAARLRQRSCFCF